MGIKMMMANNAAKIKPNTYFPFCDMAINSIELTPAGERPRRPSAIQA